METAISWVWLHFYMEDIFLKDLVQMSSKQVSYCKNTVTII
jgi:hypothetical protein